MSFWNKLFGKKDTREAPAAKASDPAPASPPVQEESPAAEPESSSPAAAAPGTPDWYFAEDAHRNMRQVVIEIPAPDWRESEFGVLMLAAKYKFLITSGWTVDFFRTDSEPAPYMMIRTDHVADKMKASNLRIGFTFIRMQRSGLIGFYVEPSPLPATDCNPFIELVSGLDIQDYRDRISAVFAKDTLDIVLADRSNMTVSFMDETGSSESHAAPSVIGETNLPVDPEMKATLQREWRDLLAYHDALPSGQVNHVQAVQQLWEVMPMDQSPLLSRKP